MAVVQEQELFCQDCGVIKPFPICCGREMDLDKDEFYCPICGKVLKLPKCPECGKNFSVRVKKRDLKQELFS